MRRRGGGGLVWVAVGAVALAGCTAEAGATGETQAWIDEAMARTQGLPGLLGSAASRLEDGAASLTLDYRSDPARPTAIEASCFGSEPVTVSYRITSGASVGVGEIDLDCAGDSVAVPLDPDTVGEVDEITLAAAGGSADGAFAVTVLGSP